MTARLFITATPPRSADALLPEASYYSLFHFDGSLQVLGRVTAETEISAAESFGGAAFVPDAAVPGYRIGSGAGIRYGRSILPGTASGSPGTADGAAGSVRRGFVPATVTVLVVPEEEPKGTLLLELRSDTGTALFSLRFDSEGALSAVLGTPAGAVELPSGIRALASGTLQRLDLSLYVRDDTVAALWFLNGVQTAAVVRPALLPPVPDGATTVIGGENGFRGLIAELGVYYQDEQGRRTVDPGIYRSAMRKRFGSALILAEGFEGLYVPTGFGLRGEATPGSGVLSMNGGSVLESPLFESVLPETILEIEARTGIPPGSRIVLSWEGEEKGFAEIRGNGDYFDSGSSEREGSLDVVPNTLVLRLSERTLQIQSSPRSAEDAAEASGESRLSELSIRRSPEGSRWLRVTVVAPPEGSESSFELDRILVYGKPTP
jgi:hypothetical protein